MLLLINIFIIIIICLIHVDKLFSYEITDKNAVVTLVTGVNTGYHAGALALGQSIIDIGSKLRRIVMVTPEVTESDRKLLSKIYEVREVKPISCIHKLDPSITPDKYDLQGANYKAGLKRWEHTCTKFAAWTLYDFDRIIFMDSDTLVIGPIDDALYHYSNASFVAAPEVFPPDTFNSGFIVLNPNKKEFKRIMDANKKIGSAEGGDQGVFNNGVCPQWFTADHDDPNCGRLPWIYNVEVAHYAQYSTLRKMSGQRTPSVIHFVSDGKPWKVLMMEYLSPQEQNQIPEVTKLELAKQALAHMYWRQAFFKATNEKNPRNDFLISLAEPDHKKTTSQQSIDKTTKNNIKDKTESKSKNNKKSKNNNKKEKIKKNKKSIKTKKLNKKSKLKKNKK